MNKFSKILTGVFLIIIFAFFVWFLSNDIYSGDDVQTLSDWLVEGGKFNFDGIITAFLSYAFGKNLPLLFHINPHAFSMTAGAFVRAFNALLMISVMSLFFFVGRKKTNALPFVILFSAFYFCYACSNMDFAWLNPNNIPAYELGGAFVILTEYSQNFGQLLNFVLGSAFLLCIISLFVQNKMPSEKNIILLSVFGLFCGASSMFSSIVCGTCLLFIYLYLFLLNIKNLKTVFSQNGKYILMPAVGYLAGVIAFAFYPGYLKYFSANIDFMAFSENLFKNFVLTNSFEISLILILSAILYLLAENKSTFIKRMIFCVVSVLIGCFVYFMMFSSLDKIMGFILTESQILLRLLLCMMIYMLFGACIREHQSEPQELKILSVGFVMVLLAFAVVQTPFAITNLQLWRTMSEETKNTTYCIEKMYRFYSLRGKTALLPSDSLLKIFKIQNFLNDENVKIDDDVTRRTFFKHTTFTDKYYKTFYKNPNIVAYKFINTQKALKIFFEEGGMIDAKEMKNLNFQKLYDDQFVLNRAIEKSKYDNK